MLPGSRSHGLPTHLPHRNITFSAEGEREGRGEEAVAAAGLRFLKPVARFIEEDVATTFPLLLSELEWEP